MSAWDDAGYDDSWNVSGAPGSGLPEFGGDSGGAPADTNPAGAGYDPFAYTNGTLLTPWEGHFDGSKYSTGGGGPAPYRPFTYQDFDYKAARPAAFGETYQDPGNFNYGEYTSRGPYQGPTDKDLKADKGMQFRMAQGQKAIEASKAAQGVLKTGGTTKAIQKYGQEFGSQEYDKVDQRKYRDYTGDVAEDRFRYGQNRANATENFDRNVKNQQAGFSLREGAWKDNAAVELDASRHAYDVAQGTWDRNETKARQGYDDLKTYENEVASASASGSREAYNRALDEYKMARDEFYTNQDRQYNILDNEDRKGRDAAYRYADSAYNYGNNAAENIYGGANAAASGVVGAANAKSSTYGAIGQSAADLALYAYGKRTPTAAGPTVPRGAGRLYSGVPAPAGAVG